MKQVPRYPGMTSDSEIETVLWFVISWKSTDLKLFEALSVKDVLWLDKWNLEDYQACPDLIIVTDTEMLLLMLITTRIKLTVLELANIASETWSMF